MKRFIGLISIAILLVIAVLGATAVIPAGAVSAERTIYIADGGTGDGSSPSSPLQAFEVITRSAPEGTDAYTYYYAVGADGKTGDSEKKFFKNCVLYQALEMLAETGGNIVLSGDVTIGYSKTYSGSSKTDRDYFMPTYSKPVTISAVNGAKLILKEGAHLTLGGHTTFENMEIVTEMTGRLLCCQGNTLVLGEGLTCSTTLTGTAANNYIAVAGGHRYSNNQNYNTSITVKSGTWCDIYGSNRGNAGATHVGDTSITIEGGSIKGVVNTGAHAGRAVHYGNAELLITGGSFSGDIYGCSSVGNGYPNATTKVKITGGSFASGCQVLKSYIQLSKSTGFVPRMTLDLSECTSSDAEIGYLLNGSTADSIVYPAKWCTSATVSSQPYNSVCFAGEDFDGTGLVLNVTYSNGKKGSVSYDEYPYGFTFDIDSGKTGSQTMTWKYGGCVYNTTTTEVIGVPSPVILGAQVSTAESTSDKLRFVAEVKKPYGEGVVLKDYGFIAVDEEYLAGESQLKSEAVYGINNGEISSFGTAFREDIPIYNTGKKMTFAGVYDGLALNSYDKSVAAVAYMKFSYNGKDYVRFSDVIKRSILGVAEQATQSELETNEIKAYISTNIIGAHKSYLGNKNALVDADNSTDLRAEVLALYKEYANFKWTPSATFTLNGTTYTAGNVYYGIPYVSGRKATLGQFKDQIKTLNGTNFYMGPVAGYKELWEGVSKLSAADLAYYTNSIEPNLYTIDQGLIELENFFPGCDYSLASNIWASVASGDVLPTGIDSFLPAANCGTVPVGGYDPSASSTDSKAVCTANGQDVMYAAYAQCKVGDVLVNYSTNGKTVYFVTGKIGSDHMYVSFTTSTLEAKDDGYSNFRLDRKVTFSALYNSGYIPVTIPELATGLAEETTAVVDGFDGDLAMQNRKMNGVLRANKQISEVTVRITRNGAHIFDETKYYNKYSNMNIREVNLSEFSIYDTVRYLGEGRTYILSVSAVIGAEEVSLINHSYTTPVKDLGKYYNVATFDAPSDPMQAAVDHMWEQFNVLWTPATGFYYSNLEGSTGFVPDTKFEAGKIYKGVLYANTRATLPEFQSVLGDKVWNESLGAYVYTLSGYNGETDWNYVMGNHCSAAMYHSFQQSSRMYDLSRGNPNTRLLGVKDIYANCGGDMRSITRAYGAQAMYESYALIQKGDFLYKSARGSGHTRMASEAAYVVRNADGSINPNKSYAIFVEQTDTLESDYTSRSGYNGNSKWTADLGYDTTWFMEHKYTFAQLYSGNCAIYRPTEYMTGESDRAFIGLTGNITSGLLLSDAGSNGSGIQGIVESNYPLRSVTAKIINTQTGEVVSTAQSRAITQKYSYNLHSLRSALNVNGLASGSYRFVLEVAIARGEAVLADVTFTK